MILNIYKPREWTSFDVVAKTRGILHEKKVGHAGTLDPLAEGVLIVLTGIDCAQQDTLMKGTKEYVAEISFGIDSPTYDLEFIPTVSPSFMEISSDIDITDFYNKIKGIVSTFIGKSMQTVPIYSAKKVKGKALYKTARQGVDFNLADLPKNNIEIYALVCEGFYLKTLETDQGIKNIPTLKLTIQCSHGTYIRSLAHDIGIAAHTTAVMTSLVRTRVGDLRIEDSIHIRDLQSVS